MNSYEKLLAQAQREPLKTDYRALRMAWLTSPRFSQQENPEIVTQMLIKTFSLIDLEAITVAVDDILERDYLDIEAHVFMLNVMARRGLDAKAAYHDTFAQGLLHSIMTVDGHSIESAFQVITPREEYAVLMSMEMTTKDKYRMARRGKTYDVVTGIHAKTGEEATFYFDAEWLREPTPQPK